MKTKAFMKFFCITCCLIVLLLCPVSTISAQALDIPPQTVDSDGETIEPRAPFIGWVYKEENGKKYRRLYNFTDEVWIGDWIPCD